MFVDRACVRVRVVVAARARRPRLGLWFFRFRHLAEPRSRWWSHVGLSFIPHVGGKGRVVEPSKRSTSARSSGVFALFLGPTRRVERFSTFSSASVARPARGRVPQSPRAFRPSPRARRSFARRVPRSRGRSAPPLALVARSRCRPPRRIPPSAVSPSALAGVGRACRSRCCARGTPVRVPAPPPASDQRAPPRRRPRRAARPGLVGASSTSRLAWVDETCRHTAPPRLELRLAELREPPPDARDGRLARGRDVGLRVHRLPRGGAATAFLAELAPRTSSPSVPVATPSRDRPRAPSPPPRDGRPRTLLRARPEARRRRRRRPALRP